MPKRKKPERKRWGVPVAERKIERCGSHIILKESGKRKRPRKCQAPAKYHGIKWRGREIWVCEECWNKISDLDIEWGDESE